MISSFTGNYFFLSNFFELPVQYEGVTYRNNEAAFQAQKTKDPAARMKFASYPPGVAKRVGRHVDLRGDWETVKDDIMYRICKCKFDQNPEYKAKLLSTGNERLVEGNTWGDSYWGVCDGRGQNRLGTILMRIRQEYLEESVR